MENEIKKVQEITEKIFYEKLEKETMFVDFFTTWCGPCKILAPILEKAAHKSKIPFYKINVENAQELSLKYEITSVPTMILFKKGNAVPFNNSGKSGSGQFAMEQDILMFIDKNV